MKLYSYFRSSASYRVRIVMNLKGLAFEYAPIHLVINEQLGSDFLAINPEALVPVLSEESAALTQSLAICEYLNELHPDPPLLPGDALGRARVRALALTIACEIHPLNNLRVLRYLTRELKVGEEAKDRWYRHWVETGLTAFEAQLASAWRTKIAGPFCYGDWPTLADICLVPQIFNAQRFNCDLSAVPLSTQVYDRCMTLEAFQRAAPEAQPDAA